MGILQRFGEIMESNINDLLDRAEDPVKMVDQMLRELNENLAEAKKETASVMAEETAAKRRVDELQDKVNEYTNSAKKALQAGNEGDARTLLQRKQEYDSQLEQATKTWQVAKANADNMKAVYDKLNADIVTLNDRRKNVKSQVSMTKAQERANKITEKMSKTDINSTFTRMEEKSQRALDEATAKSKLSGIGLPSDKASELNDKYSSGSSASVDAELDAMKKQLGL